MIRTAELHYEESAFEKNVRDLVRKVGVNIDRYNPRQGPSERRLRGRSTINHAAQEYA